MTVLFRLRDCILKTFLLRKQRAAVQALYRKRVLAQARRKSRSMSSLSVALGDAEAADAQASKQIQHAKIWLFSSSSDADITAMIDEFEETMKPKISGELGL